MSRQPTAFSQTPLGDLAGRYRCFTEPQISRLLDVSFEAARSRCRRLEKKGILSRRKTVAGLVYWMLTAYGAQLLDLPFRKVTRSTAAIFADIAIAEYFSRPEHASLSLLTSAEFTEVLHDLQRAVTLHDIDLPGLHRRRHYFNADQRLTRLLVDLTLPAGFNATRYIKGLQKKIASLRTKSSGWRKFIDSHGLAFTVLTPIKTRVPILQNEAAKARISLAVHPVELLSHAWGVRRDS